MEMDPCLKPTGTRFGRQRSRVRLLGLGCRLAGLLVICPAEQGIANTRRPAVPSQQSLSTICTRLGYSQVAIPHVGSCDWIVVLN